MSQRSFLKELDDPPTLEEINKVIKQLQPGEAPESNGIPPDMYKEGGEVTDAKLTKLLQQFWKPDSFPQDFKDTNIMPLYKNKGDKASCDNHQGISLLSAAGKILAHIILDRITAHLLENVV